jgi:hypothetical protein
MVRLANARAQVSAAAAATIQLAAPLIAVAANEVPFGGTVVFLIGCIANHLAAVKGNDGLARKAERLAETVDHLLAKLSAAEFDEQSPALAQLVEALAGLEAVARSWSSASQRNKVFLLRFRSGTTSALAFEAEFAACTALVDKACEGLLLAVAVDSCVGIKALQAEAAAGAAARQEEFAANAAARAMQGQTQEQLQASLAALAQDHRGADERTLARIEELERNLKATIAAAVSGGGGAAAGRAAREAAAAGARAGAVDLGVDASALELHLLDAVPALMDALAADGTLTRAAVAASQAEVVAAVESGHRSVQAQLDEVLARLGNGGGGGAARRPTDGLEPALAAFLERENLTQLGGFFLRCNVLGLRSLAAVPEADMKELGMTPMLAARIAGLMQLSHPTCPLRRGGEEEEEEEEEAQSPPVPPRQLRPVLDPDSVSPLLKEVLGNPGKAFGLNQSLEVVLELTKAGAEEALKLSGLFAVFILGITGAVCFTAP